MSEVPALPSFSSKPALLLCATCLRGPDSSDRQSKARAAGVDVAPPPLSRCGRCKCAFFCSRECQKKAWEAHKPLCNKRSKGLVACVLMVRPGKWTVEHLAVDDPRFDEAQPSPVMARIGIPLCVLPLGAGTNNQWATWFMINPVSGFAPPKYQNLGPCLILRRDRVPISTDQVALLGDYFGGLLDQFGGDDDGSIHRRLMTKAAFVEQLGWLSESNDCEGQAW